MSFQVGKYSFETEQEAKIAEKEQQAVEYVRQHLDMTDRAAVRDLYDKIRQNGTFHTVIGQEFLLELQKILTPIPTDGETPVKETSDRERTSEPAEPDQVIKEKSIGRRQLEREVRKYKQLTRIFCVTSATMAVMILGMFYVNTTSQNPTILDYEQKIIDKYATWETQLSEREQKLREGEQELQQKMEQTDRESTGEGRGVVPIQEDIQEEGDKTNGIEEDTNSR